MHMRVANAIFKQIQPRQCNHIFNVLCLLFCNYLWWTSSKFLAQVLNSLFVHISKVWRYVLQEKSNAWFSEFYIKANELIKKKSIPFNGFSILFVKPDRRYWKSLIFCSFFSPFCSLQQVTLMFIAINLSQADVQGLPVLKVLAHC